jgi:hypothetical protein
MSSHFSVLSFGRSWGGGVQLFVLVSNL